MSNICDAPRQNGRFGRKALLPFSFAAVVAGDALVFRQHWSP
jgi:hypothetical protein